MECKKITTISFSFIHFSFSQDNSEDKLPLKKYFSMPCVLEQKIEKKKKGEI